MRKAARAGEAMEAAWSATVAEGGNLVADARGLVVGDERLDLLLHLATERKDAQEQAAVAKAAAASKKIDTKIKGAKEQAPVWEAYKADR